MLLFIEGYPYDLNREVREGLTIRKVLADVVSLPAKEDTYAVEYVGYCYSKAAGDVIFFLPKVVLTGEQDEDKTVIRYSEPLHKRLSTSNQTR